MRPTLMAVLFAVAAISFLASASCALTWVFRKKTSAIVTIVLLVICYGLLVASFGCVFFG
jgi:hypothetical protein